MNYKINIPNLVCKILYLMILYLPVNVFAQSVDSLNIGIIDTVRLSEIIITAKIDVSVKSDTISYTVDSFNNIQSANTEDVLKRLPGMVVSQNGDVSMNGKKVTKIYINGIQYYTPDIRMITQNMPADILQKIQVYDWRSDEEVATGYKYRKGEKVLNLVFKEKYNAGLFGKLKAGAGEKSRYECGGIINYLGARGEQANLISDINNTNLSTNSSSNALYNNGIRTQQKYNANLSKKLNDRNTLSVSYDFSKVKTALKEESFRKTFLSDNSELLKKSDKVDYNETVSQNLQINNFLRGKFMDVRTSVSVTYVETGNKGQMFDSVSTTQASNSSFNRSTALNSNTTNAQLKIQNEFIKHFDKKGRVLNLKTSYLNSTRNSQKENTIVNNTIASNVYHNTSLNKYVNNDIEIDLRYSEPIGTKGLIFLTYKNSLLIGNGKTTVFFDTNSNNTLVNAEASLVIDSNQSRVISNRYNYSPVGLSYQYSDNRFTIGCGLEAQIYKRKNQTVLNMPVESGINYAPLLYTRYSISRRSNLDVNYGSSIILPTIYQLQSTPDYTDSLNIYQGNSELKPETNNDISISYNSINLKTNTTSWLNININWSKNMITEQTDNYINKKITRPVNTDGNYNIALSGSYSLSIIPKIFKVDFVAQANMTKKTIITNSTIQKNRYYTISPGARLSYYSKKIYTNDLMYFFSYSQTSQSLTGRKLQTHNLTNSGTFNMPFNLNLGYQFTYISNKGVYQNWQEDFFLVNLSADLLIKKIPGLTVGVKAIDLFNSYPNNVRLIKDNYIEEKSSNRLGRFIIFSLSYRFNYFPAKGN